MKIIDLLNKIANGEEIPKKIKVNNMFVYEYDNGIDYKTEDGVYLFDSYIQITNEDMNMEVEILEEEKKIPEKLDYIHPDISCSYNESELLLRIEANKDKINEIVDYLKSKGDA